MNRPGFWACERVLKQLYASGLAVLFLLGVPTSALNDPNQFVVGCIAGRPRTSGILETEKNRSNNETMGDHTNMNIKIIGVGKLKEKYFRDGIAEYLKRMDKFAKVKIVEVADEKAPETLSEAEMADVKAKEGDRILGKIKDKEWVIALAIEGKQRPSEVFAKEIADLGTYGHSDITFVIGGSLGLSPAVMKRANDTLSFGKLTMPHQLMRLVLMEQIYRAFMINIGSPYHK